ncbi:MAG: accessory gene regulator B family protein [Oscillospiraceae bacterium]|nr:accessory gene regulator B family protein [Oscillospiraceae bacterium]
MLTLVSKKIASSFVAQGIISNEDSEVYEYGLELLLSTLINLLFIIIASIISGTTVLSALFLVGFIPLRTLAGGYHAKNHMRCFAILAVVYFAFLAILVYLPLVYRLPVIIVGTLISALLVFLLSPSEDKNKPLSDERVIILRRKSRVAVTVYAVLIGTLTASVYDTRFAFALSFGVIVVGASLLANFVKNKISQQNKNA